MPVEIIFNYQEGNQSLHKENALLKPEIWTAGDMDPEIQRFWLFKLSATVLSDGELHFISSWNSAARHQDNIVLWLQTIFPAAIHETVASLMIERPQFTLHDLEKTDLRDYSEVDTLTSSVLRIPGVQSVDDVESVYYGSPIQDSLALSQSKAGSDAYEIDITWEVTANGSAQIHEQVNPEQLASAWRDTVAAHPTLRTVFLEATTATAAGMLHQIVLKKHEPCCIMLKATNTHEALDALASHPSYREQGLFLDMRPPHRLLICSTFDGKTFVRLQVNHILFDGMSTGPLLLGFARVYSGIADNERSTKQLKPFADFIRYIRDPERQKRSIRFWKSYLADAKPCLFPSLTDATMFSEPKDKMKPRIRSLSVPLDIDLSQLQHIVGELQITLPTLVHVAWALVLRLYTGESQVAFGYLASGRDAPIDGIEDAVGPFLAMLVCFVDFDRDQGISIAETMKKTHESSAKSMDHQETSLAEIHRALGLPGDSLLFNSGISFYPKLSRKVQMRRQSPLIFDIVSEKGPTEFDLSLFVEVDEHERSISMHLDYLESAISSPHATNIAASINHMLAELVSDPYRSSDELCCISKHDLASIEKWNEPLISPLERCVHDIFAEIVMAYPDKEAIYSWDGTMSYRQLDDASSRLARYLVQLAVGPEKMVPICFEKSIWTVVAILAIVKAGGCFVLLDPAHPETRLWSIIDEVDASVLLCSPLTNRSKGFKARVGRGGSHICVVEVEPGFVGSLSIPGRYEPPATPIYDTVRPDNIVYAVFTSGTTGTPKAALITHRALATGLKEHADATGMTMIGPDTRALQFASYSFDAAIGDIFTTIQVGGCLCIPSEEDRSSTDITAFIARSRANWAGITPSFAALLDPPAVPTLRALCLAGEPLPSSQVSAWVDRVRLINMYGPTECTIACVANVEVSRKTGASNIGRGYRAATWIVDENDHDRLRPVGTIGELLIEGPVLARGYLKRPEQTANVFINSPLWLRTLRPDSRLYKTGDLVRYNSDGTINFIGRKDTQIKINGQRVEVGEIESVLSTNLERSEGPIVVELLKRANLGESDILAAFVCVGGSADDGHEEKISPSTDHSIISTSQRSMAKFRSIAAKILHPQSSISTLPRYMIPAVYIPIEKIPFTVSGKTERRALQTASAQLSRAELLAFTSGLTAVVEEDLETVAEIKLAKLWQNVLNIEVIGKQSNFYHLGGDSMTAMALRAEARRAGFTLSVGDIFAHPDLADMAEVLSSSEFSSGSSNAFSDLSLTSPSTPPDDFADIKPFCLLPGIGILPSGEFIKEVSLECGISLDDVEDIFPCTPMQEGLMASASSKSREGAYALHHAFKLPPDLDAPRFLLAWEKTAFTHPVLRSRIIPRPQGSLVVIGRAALDIYQASGPDLDEHLTEQRKQTFRYGYSLFRLGIFDEEGRGSRYLIMNAHHAIYDGWSLKLIWETALALYRNSGSPYPQVPSFQAFVRELSHADHASSEAYWISTLLDQDHDGFKFPMVPGSHNPIASSTKTFIFDYSPEATRALAVTPSVLINAAWAITLSQYSASSSVVFGVTLSGRDVPLQGAEQVVGPTIATVPRQLDVRHNQSLLEFLRYVQQIVAATLPHQHLGLQRIQSLGPTARRACDFSTLLVVTPSSAIDLSPLEELGIVPVPIDVADFHPYPLALECSIEEQALNVQVSFDPDCIDVSMVGHVMQQFEHLLQSMNLCSSSSASSKSIKSLTAEISPIHLDMIIGWNSKRHSFTTPPRPCCVHQLVEEKAAQRPSEPAITSHDVSLSYLELDQLAERLSARILSIGGENLAAPFISLYMDKSVAAVVSMLAILKSGFAFMPLSPGQPLARLEGLLEAASTKLILASLNHCEALSRLSVKCHVFPVDLISLTQEQPQMKDRSAGNIPADTSRPAYLIYTSGSTGKPKGVVVEHEAWSSAIASQTAFFGFSRDTRMLQFSSYTFDVSLFEIFVTLASGGCVCVPSEHERMNDLSGFIQSMNINSLSLTPTVARLLDSREMSDVNLVVFAGEALAQADIDAWMRGGRRVINAYGPTEACVLASSRNISSGEIMRKSTNIGYPLGAELWVVSPTTDTLCPIGGIGELCIGGEQLAHGYHGDEETTERCFTNHLLDALPAWKYGRRVYRTGDLVRYESDGTLHFIGRKDGDAQVKIRGQRINVGEIEHHIQMFMVDNFDFRHTTVQLHKPEISTISDGSSAPSIVAFLVMDIQFDQKVRDVGCSYLSIGKNTSCPASIASGLRRKLRSVLPDYMVPRAFIALERLPTTASGKLDREFIVACLQGLSAPLTPASSNRQNTFSDPLTPVQELMQQWWSRVLGVHLDSISVNSDFFDLGGNSLSAIKLVSLARSSGHRISYENVFTAANLVDMAACLTVPDKNTEVAPRTASTSGAFDLLSESESRAVVEDILPLYGVDLENVEDIYPATSYQESAMAMTARNRGIYLLILTIKVPVAQLNPLKDAWTSAFQDFELLRTRIIPSNRGGAYQVVIKNRGLEWKEVPDVATFVDYVYDSHDYGQALARVGVVNQRLLATSAQARDSKNTDGTITVLLSASHAIYDGWSLSTLWPRLFSEPGPTKGTDGSSEATPFKEFIRYQMSLDSDEAVAFWSAKLKGTASSEFPGRPSTVSLDHAIVVGQSLVQKITLPPPEMVHRLGTTIAIVAQAAWALTISHFTANCDSVFRVVLSGRDIAAESVSGIETIVGPTTTVVPCRTVIDYDSNVSKFLAEFQRDNLEVARYAHIGLERISRISQDCQNACALNSNFNFQALSSDEPIDNGPEVFGPKMLDTNGFAPHALIADLSLITGSRELSVTLSYDPVIVQGTQSSIIMDVFMTILNNLFSADLTTPLREIGVISGLHLQQHGKIQGPGHGLFKESENFQACLHHLMRKQVEKNPFQHAIDSWDGTMTYMQLEDLSSSLAESLACKGVGPHKAVGLIFEMSKWAVVAMLGVVKAGGFFTLIDPKTPQSLVERLLDRAGASVILIHSSHVSQYLSVLPFRLIIVDEKSLPPPTTAFLKPPYLPSTQVTGSNVACMLLGPQETGTSEVTTYEHGLLCSLLTKIGKRIGLSVQSRSLHHNASWSPIALLEVFGALTHGGTVCIPSESQRVEDFAACIESFQCNVAIFDATASGIPDAESVPSLQTVCLISDDILPLDLNRWASKLRVLSDYHTPMSQDERLMASLWRDILGIKYGVALGRSDDFFDLGGNSLLAMRLGAQLRRQNFAIKVPDMLKNPTLARMTASMKRMDEQASTG